MGKDTQLLNEFAKQNDYLRAIAALLAQNYEQQASAGAPRIELFLAGQGLGYQDIAQITGKKPDAVRMFLKRQQTPKNI